MGQVVTIACCPTGGTLAIGLVRRASHRSFRSLGVVAFRLSSLVLFLFCLACRGSQPEQLNSAQPRSIPGSRPGPAVRVASDCEVTLQAFALMVCLGRSYWEHSDLTIYRISDNSRIAGLFEARKEAVSGYCAASGKSHPDWSLLERDVQSNYRRGSFWWLSVVWHGLRDYVLVVFGALMSLAVIGLLLTGSKSDGALFVDSWLSVALPVALAALQWHYLSEDSESGLDYKSRGLWVLDVDLKQLSRWQHFTSLVPLAEAWELGVNSDRQKTS
mgnify:CR=1 FL=1